MIAKECVFLLAAIPYVYGLSIAAPQFFREIDPDIRIPFPTFRPPPRFTIHPPPRFTIPRLPPPRRITLPRRPSPRPRPSRRPTSPPIRYEHNVIVPKSFRVGAVETVILNLYLYPTARVTAYLRELPRRDSLFNQIPAKALNGASVNQPVKLEFVVNENDIPDFRKNQRVEMVIEVRNSPADFTETITVDVNKESGYLFIQTDRPIYRPSEYVEIRVFPLEQDMSPERDNLVEITVKTPDGIGAYREIQRLPPFGFVETIFNVAEYPMFGTWSVEAKFVSEAYETTTEAEFVIRRYVLPTFNVKIDMDKNFFLVTDNAISGYIRSNYSYGEPVNGNYFLTMKLKKTPTSEPIVFFKMPSAGSYLFKADFENGEHPFSIPLADVLDKLGPGENLETLADNSGSISVEATVNARADGVMESDITPDLPFLKTPYLIDTSRTVKFFIPGLTYHLEADVRDVATGETASGIPIKVQVGSSNAATRLATNDKGEISTRLDFVGGNAQVITISTALDNVADVDQSRVTINLLPYSSPSNSFLQINIPNDPARVGQGNYFLTFQYLPNTPSQIRYMVLARGVVVATGSNQPNSGTRESTQRLTILQSMVPAARVVAYYHSGSELVSSSVWLDVVDQCKHEITVEAPNEVLPGASVPFTIRGQPSSMIGLSGVDKAAYFLHQQTRLTRSTMFNKMGDYDRGCTRGGGSNAHDVFTGAGLSIYGMSLPNPRSSSCSGSSSRKKRSILEDPQVQANKLAQCARDGGRESLADEDCEARSARCRDNYEDQYPGCWKAFRDACYKAAFERRLKEFQGLSGTGNEAEAEASVEERRAAYQDNSSPWTVTTVEVTNQFEIDSSSSNQARRPPPPVAPKPAPTFRPVLRPAGVRPDFFRPEFNIHHGIDSLKPSGGKRKPSTTSTRATTTTTTTPAPTKVTGLRRSDFSERLSWPTLQIKSNGERSFLKRARDSITTFVIDAIGMHDSPDGFCVAEPTELRVFKDVFVQLNTPYSLKKREQADLRIVIFNYNQDNAQDLIVRVKMERIYCSQFQPDVWSELIRLQVEAGGSSSASVSVLPLSVPDGDGRAEIEVEIRDERNYLIDAVKKSILIEPEGDVKDVYETFPLDLTAQNHDSFDINFAFPENFVPGTRVCWIYGYTNFMGPSIEVDEVTKEPRDIKSFFRMPYGCGEQNMLVTGPNVYAHMYLTATNKLVPGTPQYQQSIKRMQDGFNRELKYRSEVVNFRAWAVFKHYLPSTWLNAFVDRVFIKAKLYYTDLDEMAICNSLDWLLGEQDDEGFFHERRPPVHREMHGAVGGRLSLTTYVLITLIDSEGVCSSGITSRILTARNKAVAFLEVNKNSAAFQRPYALALLSYALSLHNPGSNFAREINTRLLALKSYTANMRHVFWRGRPVSDIEGTDAHAYWYKRRPQAIDVEATAYALLAQVEFAKAKSQVVQDDLDLTRKIVLWLISQRNDGGAFISTQDTVVGLQALATYQIWVSQVNPPPAVVSMDVTFESAGDTTWSDGHTVRLDERNEGLKMEIDVPTDVMQARELTVNARGTGEGVLSYRCIYRTVIDEDPCHFEITQNVVVLSEGEVGGTPKTVKLTISVSKPVGAQAEASIIEVGLLSGYTAVAKSVEKLAIESVVDGTVERYEITSQSLILYMNRIGTDVISFAFSLEQHTVVDNPQPAKINVYDYYEPSIRCGIFYSLPNEISELRTANCAAGDDDSICKCAEGACPVCRTRDQQISNTTCLTFEGADCDICDSPGYCENMFEKACRSNYVYIVQVTQTDEVTASTVFATFKANIVEIYKYGTEVVDRNEERTFMTRNDCHALCKDPSLAGPSNNEDDAKYLRPGIAVMIMGTAPLPPSLDKNGNLASMYLLAKGTTMERVITEDKCVRHNERYVKLRCGDPNHPKSPRQQIRCIRHKKFKESCENQRRLKEYLKEGCD